MPQTPLFKRWDDNIYPVSPKGLFCNNVKIIKKGWQCGEKSWADPFLPYHSLRYIPLQLDFWVSCSQSKQMTSY